MFPTHNIPVFILKAKADHADKYAVAVTGLLVPRPCFPLLPEKISSLLHFQLEMTTWLSSSHRKVSGRDRYHFQAWFIESPCNIWTSMHFPLPAWWRQVWGPKAIVKSPRQREPGSLNHSVEVSCLPTRNIYLNFMWIRKKLLLHVSHCYLHRDANSSEKWPLKARGNLQIQLVKTKLRHSEEFM